MIRTAAAADARALAALEAAAFGAEAWSESGLRDELARADRIVLVDRDVDTVTGYVDVSVAADVADLLRVAVDRAARRHGRATALIDAATVEAARRGAERMLLEVAADNDPALALYQRHGFVELVRRRGYYAGGRDAVVMERALRVGDEAAGAAS